MLELDTVSARFSKGVGAPAGSAFYGTREPVERAGRFRKMWGHKIWRAGMRAAAILADASGQVRSTRSIGRGS
jgi:threonine aldolase